MLFNSLDFLFFFPIVLLVLFLLPKKLQWIWLLASSYYFYMGWNAKYAILIFISTIVTYSTSLLIAKARTVKVKKLWVFLSFFINLSILFFFKYFNFAVDTIKAVYEKTGMSIDLPVLDVLLPVGISFYTFQALSYTVDVYRGDIKPTKHFGKYALFVSFFPQLVAGPIERTTNLLPQFNKKVSFNYNRLVSGLYLISWGFFKKIVIADRVAIVVNTVYASPNIEDGFGSLLAMLLFSVQIYCDFSAYSDIAIGVARIMGFDLMKNFDNPYFSQSITEFWRRWHISLSTWFRDYLYIPLGGNRKGKNRQLVNLFLVFLISGLWHGAGLNFIIWGSIHGVLIVFEKMMYKKQQSFYRLIRWDQRKFSFKIYKILITFSIVTIAWVFFRADTFSDAIVILRSLNTLELINFFSDKIVNYGLDFTQIIISAIAIIILFVVDFINVKKNIISFIQEQNIVFRWVIAYSIIFIILIFGYFNNEQANFIYFQF